MGLIISYFFELATFPQCVSQHNVCCGILYNCCDIPQFLDWGYFKARIENMLLKCSVVWTAVLPATRHLKHLLKAFRNCWPNPFSFFCPTQRIFFLCIVHMSPSERSTFLFTWNDSLFSGAKGDFVIFVSLYCLCASLGRIIELESERVTALSAARNILRGQGLVSCFLHIFWPVSQGQRKEVSNSSEHCGWLL